MKTEIIAIIVLSIFAMPNVLRGVGEFISRLGYRLTRNKRDLRYHEERIDELEKEMREVKKRKPLKRKK